MNTINFSGDQFNEIKVAADWIRDLESSDSRLHKESVIEKALMASKLGSVKCSMLLVQLLPGLQPLLCVWCKKSARDQRT
jgi:hypothetical protein